MGIVETNALLHNDLLPLSRIAKMNNSTNSSATGFDWNLVRSFLAALDTGSLLGAGRTLSISQPTVGRHIAQLEAQWGQALFERTGRGLQATEAALRLADSARAMEIAAQQLGRDLQGSDDTLKGSVRVSASQPVACYLLPKILVKLRQQLPQINIELVVSNEVSNLLRRDADIALRMVRPEQAGLTTKKIGQVTLGVYAHQKYLKRRGVPRTVADLLQHDLIGDDSVLAGVKRAGYPWQQENFALFTLDLIANTQALLAGFGIGFISDYAMAPHTDCQRLLPDFAIPALPIWLTVHREIRGNRRIRAVYDLLAQEVPMALTA